MARKQGFPSYFGLRIYFPSSLLYFFLVMPFLGFLAIQNIPKIAARKQPKSDFVGGTNNGLQEADSLPASTLELDKASADSSFAEESGTIEDETTESTGINPLGDEGPFVVYFSLLALLSVAAYLVGWIYNHRFKRYFKWKRQGREISDKHHHWCKKHLLKTPIINALILTTPALVGAVFALVYILSGKGQGDALEHKLFRQFFYLVVVSTLLQFLFVFYWQKHRVQLRYLDIIYSPGELQGNIFGRKRGSIKDRLILASGMTTFLPLLIVIVYLVLSLSPVKELGITELSDQQREILIGQWSNLGKADGIESMKTYNRLSYVNVIDAVIMLSGIGTGILVSLVYILAFIRWTNEGVTRPVRELQTVIRNTKGDDTEAYCVVRTNDEIGELAEGYNQMTRKIHSYVENISAMNRDLEKKVKERTNEVVLQKEEIEAQLDLTRLQKDTIVNQNEQILDSIRYAERIQMAMLPPLEGLKNAFSEHFVLFKPRDIVSGDYYWVATEGARTLVAVADCTGHGVPGALLSMLGISSMNEIINRHKGLSANEILTLLRSLVIASLHQTGHGYEARDGIEIALIIADPEKGELQFAGANRPLYLFEADQDKEDAFHHFRADRMPIGIYEQEATDFRLQKTKLNKGDQIYLFSDGYVDQLGGPDRKTFRAGRFRKVLSSMQTDSMAEQKKMLERHFLEWKGTIEQIDDVLVMGLKV
ncbi:MAG: hypothetical protein CSA96_02680 [Bacteroidetes bacterium]|nr:MAG: hypothetical protein CSA96_02680 [Bacteroidota bacterium]